MDESMNGSRGVLVGAGIAGGDSGPDVRSELLALMVGSEDEFRHRAANRLAQLPAYCAVPADRLTGILDEITWVYHAFLGCLSQRRELSPPEIDHLEAIGHDRARQSIPISELHSAFQTVLDDSLIMLEGHARGLAAHDPAALEVVPDFNRSLTRFALQATEAMGRGHARPAAHADVSSGDVWIQRMLATVAADDPEGLPDLVIVLPAGPDAGLAAVLHELTATFGEAALAGPIVSAPVQHAVALVGHGLDRTEAAACYGQIARRHHTVVVHGPILHPGHMAEFYGVMRPYLGAATPALPEPGAVALDDMMLLVTMATVPQDVAAASTWRLLGPLLATSGNDPLLQTLEVYLSTNGRIEQTARTLKVTAKTVRARLGRITEAIGRPLQRGADNVQPLCVALGLLKIHRDTWPPAGDPRWHADPTTR